MPDIMLDADTQNEILKLLQEKNPHFTAIDQVNSLSGGDINAVYKIRSGDAAFVVKQNYADKYPEMFRKEAAGLDLLGKSSAFNIPQVIGTCEASGQSCLVLEYIASSNPKVDFWKGFAHNLVELHQNTSENNCFGLDYSNYIGSLVQPNQWTSNWFEFYAEQRLLPMFQDAYDQGHFTQSDHRRLEQVISNLENNIPNEKPALLHGDLWSGNYLVDEDGNPCLIDPAVYYGHRETELAFMQLFGGFDSKLFEVYQQKFPLEPGFEKRKELHQLYPLLVHSVLFGGHYVQQVRGILNRAF
ncbi:MAG: fructosamine kinase family protein [Chitinophagales bacterium]